MAVLASLIVGLAFLSRNLAPDPQGLADTPERNGGFVPGYRPGKNTADYLNWVQIRSTTVGAL